MMERPLPYRCVSFDFDGTLADSARVVESAARYLARKEGLDLARRDIREWRRLPLGKKLRLAGFVFRIQPRFRKLYAKMLERIAPFPGMLPLLGKLQQAGYKVSVLSSNDASSIRRFLDLQGVDRSRLPVLSSGGLLGKGRAIRELARREGVSPRELLYVGDELRDVRACQQSGADIALVAWGMDGRQRARSRRIVLRARTPGDLERFLLG